MFMTYFQIECDIKFQRIHILLILSTRATVFIMQQSIWAENQAPFLRKKITSERRDF